MHLFGAMCKIDAHSLRIKMMASYLHCLVTNRCTKAFIFDEIWKGQWIKKPMGLFGCRFFNFQPFFNETLSITFFFFRPFEPCAQIWPNSTAQCTFCYCTACTLHWFSNFFVFQGRELIFLCGIELRFHNILIHYLLIKRVRTVHILHCTARTLHRFPNFFVFKAREL